MTNEQKEAEVKLNQAAGLLAEVMASAGKGDLPRVGHSDVWLLVMGASLLSQKVRGLEG